MLAQLPLEARNALFGGGTPPLGTIAVPPQVLDVVAVTPIILAHNSLVWFARST